MNNMKFENSQIITLKNKDFFERQKIAGKTVATCLNQAKKMAVPGSNILEIEEELSQIIEKNNCTPTFYQYKGFPGKICASVNKELVHGIPRDYKLKSGDVLKIDLGATYQRAIADAARTFIVGQPLNKTHIELVETCKKALTRGIECIKLGARVGSIGAAISRYVRDTSRFGLITNYGGHGIDEDKPHAPPFVANKADKNMGPRFQSGMTLAIEPMLTLSDNSTHVSSDGWTVFTREIGVHFEDTIFIDEASVVHTMTRTE